MGYPKKEEDIAEVIRRKLEAHKKRDLASYGVKVSSNTEINPNKVEFGKNSNPRKEQTNITTAASSHQTSSMAGKKKKNYFTFLIILVVVVLLLLILAFLGFLFYYFYFNETERVLIVGDGLERAFVKDEGIAYLFFNKGINLSRVSRVTIIFLRKDRTEISYEPGYVAGQYDVSASQLGLLSFKDIVSVRFSIEYFANTQAINNSGIITNLTRNQTNQSKIISGGGKSGGSGGSQGGGGTVTPPVCTPNCALKKCGDNGCRGSCGTCISGYSCVSGRCIFSDGLVSYWDFEGNANDVFGSNHGLVNGTTLINGIFGQGYYFDGINDFIVVNNSDSLNFDNSSFSLSLWVMSQDTGDFSRIIEKLSENGWSLYNGGEGSNKLRNYIRVNSTSFVSTGYKDVFDNRFHHIAVVYDRENKVIRQYIDGVLSLNYSMDAEGSANSSSNLFIGSSNASSNFYKGIIDEIVIWKSALRDKEIVDEYESNKIKQLVSYWSFEGDANDLISGYDGIVYGASVRKGIRGAGFSFDGINDYVNISKIGDFGQQGTISVWINPKRLSVGNSEGIIYLRTDLSGDTIRLYKNQPWNDGALGWLNYYSAINGGLGSVLLTYNFSLGEWQHTAFTWDERGDARIYVNGEIAGNMSPSNFFFWVTGGEYLFLGKSRVYNYFNGSIDELKIWNYDLTLDEIKEEYNSAKQGGILEKKLVSYWDFDGDANDSVGKNHGNVIGPVLSDGLFGQSYKFDGMDDYIDLGSDYSLNFGHNNFTISAWVKTNFSDSMTIISKREDSEYYWHFRIYGIGNQLALLTNNGTGPIYHQSGVQRTLNDGSWHQITVSRDSGNRIVYYVDGQFLSSVADEGQDTFNGNKTLIGGYMTSGGYPFNGTMDEVKIWNYPLNSTEVQDEYNNYFSPMLVSYWSFNENLDDVKGINNGTAYSNPVNILGARSGAYRFDGVDDYIKVNNSETLNFRNNFTVSAWVNMPNQYVFFPGVVWKDDNFFIRYSNGSNPREENMIQAFIRNSTGDLEPRAQIFFTDYDKWFNIVSTYDSEFLKLYIDGELKNSVYHPESLSYSNGDFYIAKYWHSPEQFFNGTIDELKVWNYALNETSVMDEYQSVANLLNCTKCADFNHDGKIDIIDNAMFTNCVYNSAGCNLADFDLNNDGIISIAGDTPCFFADTGKDSNEIYSCRVVSELLSVGYNYPQPVLVIPFKASFFESFKKFFKNLFK